jgi:hypothetical protein
MLHPIATSRRIRIETPPTPEEWLFKGSFSPFVTPDPLSFTTLLEKRK